MFVALLARALMRRREKAKQEKKRNRNTFHTFHETVVVVGAGVAGLSCAFELATSSPKCHVTLMESADACGGMLRSRRLLAGNTIELGPRSMRSVGSESSLRALRLIDRVGLAASLRTPQKGVASRRFVWLPPTPGELFLMPISLVAVFRLVFKFNVWPALILNDLLLAPLRSLFGSRAHVVADDPSVHEFLTYHVGETAATVLGSALVHGVFAGDSRQLSMRQCFPALARIADEHGSIVIGAVVDSLASLFTGSTSPLAEELSVEARAAVAARLYSLDGGMQKLTDTLVTALYRLPNVKILTGAHVSEIEEHTDRVVVHCSGGKWKPVTANRVVCAAPLHALADMLPRLRPALADMTFADVTCVSLVGGVNARELVPAQHAGFGVLASRGACNDALLLGVIFESCVFAPSRNEPTASVVTVMLGGSNERQMAVRNLDDSALRERALQAVERLGVARVEVKEVVIHRWRNAIPQFLAHGVDARRRAALSEALRGKRVVLAGAAYGAGVGVPDCITSGLDAADEIRQYESATTN